MKKYIEKEIQIKRIHLYILIGLREFNEMRFLHFFIKTLTFIGNILDRNHKNKMNNNRVSPEIIPVLPETQIIISDKSCSKQYKNKNNTKRLLPNSNEENGYGHYVDFLEENEEEEPEPNINSSKKSKSRRNNIQKREHQDLLLSIQSQICSQQLQQQGLFTLQER